MPDGGNDNQSPTSQPRPPRRNPDNAASSADANTDTTHRQLPPAFQTRQRNPPGPSTAHPTATTSQGTENRPRKEGSRRSRFGAGLTQPEPSESTTPHTPRKNQGKALLSNHEGDDLTSTLIRGLTLSPYHDCPICFSSVRPDQAIWSCSPSSPLIQNGQKEPSQYCWTSFHVKCIRSWADKSVKEVAEAWRARGEPDKKGDWRCPGCQAKRDIVPSGYWYSFFSL
jgi:transcriptional repressor NF-X1